jgi:hypothetical protein
MTYETAQIPDRSAHGPGAFPLLEIAAGLAAGVHALVPSTTVAVVAAIGSEWQLLASRGSIDVAATWRATIANQVRDSDLPQKHGNYLVSPFASVDMHALLIVTAESAEQMPRRANAIVQPLLDAGGILLDRALAVQERDRTVRRMVRRCEERDVRPVRTITELEDAIASLWPDTTAHFYDPNDLAGTCWSARRLVRVACDLDQPSIGRTPAYDGLMPRDLTYQITIPVPSREGAILIESPAAGEEFDVRSLATAIALTDDIDRTTSSDEFPVVHHA